MTTTNNNNSSINQQHKMAPRKLLFAIASSFVLTAVGASGPVPRLRSTPTSLRHLENIPSPSLSGVSVKETNFRQEFLVGTAREFDNDDVLILETLFQRTTAEYSPDSEASSRVTTTCVINRQSIYTVDPDLVDETEDHLLLVDYTMRFESSYYNVTTYPQLYQNWTKSNLDTLLMEMQSLGLDVTTLDRPKRIVVSTHAPSAMPTTVPTSSPTPSIGHTTVPSIAPSLDKTSSTTTAETKRMPRHNNVVILYAVLIVIPLLILMVVLVHVMNQCFLDRKRREDRTSSCNAKGAPTVSDPEDGRGSRVANSPTDTSKRGNYQADDVETIDSEDPASISAEDAFSSVTFGRMQSIEIE